MKPHSFVLKGIDSKPEEMQSVIEEIKQDLETKHNLTVKNIYKLKTKGGSLFVVQTNNTVYLKYLVNNVRYVCHTKITWERLNKQDPWVQCRRCQKLGHSTSNCRASPQCVKCSEAHWSKDCTKVMKEDKETHSNIKCANCSGKHLAFSKECPILQKRQQMIQHLRSEREEKHNIRKPPALRKVNYVMAPQPKENAWTQRTIINERATLPNYPVMASDSAIGSQCNFTDLVSEFNVLGQLVDLNKMINLVRELNSLLKKCKDELEKFMTLNNFCLKHFQAQTARPSASP